MKDDNENTQGQNPQWPGDHLRKAGEKDVKKSKQGTGEITETTIIPEIRNDGKKYEGDAQL